MSFSVRSSHNFVNLASAKPQNFAEKEESVTEDNDSTSEGNSSPPPEPQQRQTLPGSSQGMFMRQSIVSNADFY